jgi:tetratricopeptide (TPR) repeat protein
MFLIRKALFLAAALLGSPILGAAADDVPAGVTDTETPVSPQALAEIAANASLAHDAVMRGDIQVGEQFYQKLLAVDAPDSAKRQGLFDMFEVYRIRKIYSKAIAVGERIHSLFPDDPNAADVLLKLGRIYRETGAYQLATARFYNVLNAALRVDQSELAKYKDYSMQAEFEIADTYVDSGDYKQAARMYSLLDRLDLTQDQKAHTEFEGVYCTFLLGDYAGAVDAGRKFFESFGRSAYAPQCHYVVSVALKALGREQEAVDETLALLRMEKNVAKSDSDAWIYWQKKTGNQLANQMYQQGDYLRALTIYQAMAKLSDDPEWRWPVIYQVGLCFERLGLPDRATEAYQFIQDENKKAQAASKPIGDDLTQLVQMAEWRSGHVQWQQTTSAQLRDLLGPPTEQGTNPPPGASAISTTN